MAWIGGGKPKIFKSNQPKPPKPKPRPKPKPKPKPGPGPSPAPGGTAADHATLDVAAMQGDQAAPDETQVTTEGGPSQEGAVFSTGGGSAPQLQYQQRTTYQQVYADQVAQSQAQQGGGG